MVMEAGPELDRKVAEAIGLTIVPGTREDRVHVLEWTGYYRPSIDLNMAFEAAEKAGLFGEDEANAMLTKGIADLWVLSWGQAEHDLLMSKTPALVICAAILKLKEEVGGTATD
jgi:hypothetical protein